MPSKRNWLEVSPVPAVSKSTAPTRITRSIMLCEMLTFWTRSKRAVCSSRARIPRRTRRRWLVTW